MNIYIMRHGIAVKANKNNIKLDFNRALTKEGIKETKLIAKKLKKMALQPPQLIFSSALIRAIQTAEIIKDIWAINAKIYQTEFLNPNQNIENLVRHLKNKKILTNKNINFIMLMGHMPYLENIISYFITSITSGVANINIDLKKSAIAKINFEDKIKAGSGCLEWLITPKIIK